MDADMGQSTSATYVGIFLDWTWVPKHFGYMQKAIPVAKLLLDIENYRNIKQDSQKAARDAVIAEQGRKLVRLADDILEFGISPIELTLVVEAEDGSERFIVVEGNRRLTAIQLMLMPELAEGTELHAAFKKLNKQRWDNIPKILDCVIASSKKAAMVWINRKHASGLEGAGTEAWSAIAKARAEREQGLARPDLDVVDFILTQPHLDPKIRSTLQGSGFNLTTLKRLVEAKDVQAAVGFSIQDGKIIADQDKDRIGGIFTGFAAIIATGKHGAGKFTERTVDTKERRATFLHEFLHNHPKKKAPGNPWVVSGEPKPAVMKGKTQKPKITPSTDEQPNLVPKKFKLELPAGKVNDVFVEIKELDVTKRRNAVSVLFRVFFEMTLDHYIKKHHISTPHDKGGIENVTLITKLRASITHAKSTNLLTDKELKPMDVAISNQHSFLSPNTLNAYVHSTWLSPEPRDLKLAWANCQLFIERLWSSKK